jgi:hypothetical protein
LNNYFGNLTQFSSIAITRAAKARDGFEAQIAEYLEDVRLGLAEFQLGQ